MRIVVVPTHTGVVARFVAAEVIGVEPVQYTIDIVHTLLHLRGGGQAGPFPTHPDTIFAQLADWWQV